jgi:RNA polymerase sigma factor (sigma-70 family)
VREGDASALGLVQGLVRRCSTSLPSAGAFQDWEDVSQDVLIAVLGRDPARGEPRSLPAYVCATARHACIDALRREKGRRRTRGAHPEAGEGSAWRRNVPLDHAGSLAAPASAQERLLDEGVLEGLARLAEPERCALTCKYLFGFSDEEAALELGVSFAGYRRLVARGVAALRRGARVGHAG